VRRDALCDYLKQTGLNMVFVIRLRRQRPYNYRYRDSEYDPGTSRAYILRSDGRLETVMKADLVEKGKQLVKELGGEREPFLRKWMAHYLAELMERTESANEQEAQTAKDKCAKIITKLWEQGIERDVTQLRNKLWRLIPISSDDIDYNSLRNALANPEQVKKLDESTIEIYFSLADVEDWLVRILAISHVISTPEEEIEDESVNRLMQQENGKQMVKRIAKLFPAFAELEITDLVAVDQQVSVALRAIYQLRLILLGVEEGGSLAK